MILPYLVPVLNGVAFVAVVSLVRDPAARLRLNAAVTVGASGTYLAGGTFGPWELLRGLLPRTGKVDGVTRPRPRTARPGALAAGVGR